MRNLTCAVGLTVGSISAVNQMSCDGYCAQAGTVLNGVQTTIAFCASANLYYALETSPNGCIFLTAGAPVLICFCSTNNCNYNGTTALVPAPDSIPIICYQGITIGSTVLSSRYAQCRGDCFSASFNTTLANSSVSATIYSCNPTSVCNKLGIRNKCINIDGGNGALVNGCCW